MMTTPTAPPLPSQAWKSNSHVFTNTNANMPQHLSSRTKLPIHPCTTACNAKVFIITSTDSDPSSDPPSDRRQTRCCDSNLNANNFAGSRFKSHPSNPSCSSSCIEYDSPSSIDNSTSLQTARHSDGVLSQESGIAHSTPRKYSLRYIFISCVGASIVHH